MHIPDGGYTVSKYSVASLILKSSVTSLRFEKLEFLLAAFRQEPQRDRIGGVCVKVSTPHLPHPVVTCLYPGPKEAKVGNIHLSEGLKS